MGNEQICNMLRGVHDYLWYYELARSFECFCLKRLLYNEYETSNHGKVELNYNIVKKYYNKACNLRTELQVHGDVKALSDESLDLLASLIIADIEEE